MRRMSLRLAPRAVSSRVLPTGATITYNTAPAPLSRPHSPSVLAPLWSDLYHTGCASSIITGMSIAFLGVISSYRPGHCCSSSTSLARSPTVLDEKSTPRSLTWAAIESKLFFLGHGSIDTLLFLLHRYGKVRSLRWSVICTNQNMGHQQPRIRILETSANG